ncbi:cytokinesis protein 3, partial [Ascosphaera atra]
AIYSWGGETKKDLGFVEGDLIECLNAGDGSWWMGRLRRDQRMVGLFPSNFVRVLGDDFAPEKFRKASPAFEKPSPAPQQKQKPVFRKPFQGYKEAVGPSEQLRQAKAEQAKTASTARTTVHRRSGIHSSSRPASRQTLHRSPSPAPQPAQPRPISRISSPAPPVTVPISRSPAPQPVQPRPISRIPSPAPPVTVPISRSPAPQQPVTLPPYSASPLHFPPSPFSGASHRSPAPRPRSPIPYALRPLKPPSPALSPARTPVENAPFVPQSKYAYDPQFARHDSFHSQGSRKRSGTYPSVRPPQPPPLQLPQRSSAFLPPPEPLAPASPQHRAPSPNSIFAAHAMDPEDDPYARRSPYHDDTTGTDIGGYDCCQAARQAIFANA